MKKIEFKCDFDFFGISLPQLFHKIIEGSQIVTSIEDDYVIWYFDDGSRIGFPVDQYERALKSIYAHIAKCIESFKTDGS